MADFKLEIISQRWLSDTPDGSYERGQRDSCSHGSVYCEIAGTKISSDDDEYGISQSALALLRTIDNDRVETDLDRNVPFDYGFLLCHGCGYPLSFGCTNFGTNWWVRHDGGDVILSVPLLVDEKRVQRFETETRIPVADYAREVTSFAREARRFYFLTGPRDPEDWELDLHRAFWVEYHERLARAELVAANAELSAE